MRDLLDNAQYAPTSGRFKVYIIDEVHMLSKSAFNAMLKTLEEPPAHVKFILATTDPQKVPVTVLSRCLQFNLRQMAGTSITSHLQNILQQENIPFEPTALHLISRAAAGSMRDALSLTDQAIAYGGQTVNEVEVRAMLGAVDQSYLHQLLDALLEHDGSRLMQQAQMMEERSLSFDVALNDLAQLLHQIAVIQTVPEIVANDWPERDRLLHLAQAIPPETLQLYYQIALLGRRDIGLAPDEFAGFTMTMLRMLAFTPNDGQTLAQAPQPISISTGASSANTPTAPQQRKTAPDDPVVTHENFAQAAGSPSPDVANEEKRVHFNGNWRGLVDNLKLGLARELARHCELVSYDAHTISLNVPEAQNTYFLPTTKKN